MGTRKTQAGFQAALYELTMRAFLASLLNKTNLDNFWIKDESLEDYESLPPPETIAVEITENLEYALEQFSSIQEDLEKTTFLPIDTTVVSNKERASTGPTAWVRSKRLIDGEMVAPSRRETTTVVV